MKIPFICTSFVHQKMIFQLYNTTCMHEESSLSPGRNNFLLLLKKKSLTYLYSFVSTPINILELTGLLFLLLTYVCSGYVAS